MQGSLSRVTFSPAGLPFGQQRREGVAPLLDHRPIGLAMKLHTVSRAAESESLVVNVQIAGEPDGATRQDEGIVVPLEGTEAIIHACEDRVRDSVISQFHLAPAEPGRTAH